MNQNEINDKISYELSYLYLIQNQFEDALKIDLNKESKEE